MTSVAYIDHPDCLLHEMGRGHPESPERVITIKNALQNKALLEKLTQYLAPLADRDSLIRVHNEQYVDKILQFNNHNSAVYLDPDTLMTGSTPQAALRAAGAAILAVDLVLTDKHQRVFCNVRPPGHHALRNGAMGFCFFNNVAVAAYYAIEKYGLDRVAIMDFDVHHGNGTEDIIKNDPRILLCSTFQHPFYPYSGANTRSDHIINIALPAGTNGKIFRESIEYNGLPRLEKFAPQLIFFSAGFDAHEDDPLATLRLREEDYAWITEKVLDSANKFSKGRTISLLEGGYNLWALGESASSHVNALIQD